MAFNTMDLEHENDDFRQALKLIESNLRDSGATSNSLVYGALKSAQFALDEWGRTTREERAAKE